MRCRRCGHAADCHNQDSCNVRIMTGWNEDVRAFTGERPCKCTGYVAPPNTHNSGCAHEFLPASPNCVHCGQIVNENA